MEKLRITLDELPLRARKLSEGELTNVFGGCIGPWTIGCQANSECCPGLSCVGYQFMGSPGACQ